LIIFLLIREPRGLTAYLRRFANHVPARFTRWLN
jgi:hypothetical protein